MKPQTWVITLIWASLLAAFLVLASIAMKQADAAVRVCGERAKLVKMLAGKYQEHPRAIGVSSTGKSLLEVYTSPEGSWTVLMTTAQGMACIMGAGHSWQDKVPVQYLPKG